MNGSFLRYERYERSVNFQKTPNPTGASSVSPPAAQAASAGVQAKPELFKSNPSANTTISNVAGASATAALARGQSTNEKSLIDFGEEEFDPLSKYL